MATVSESDKATSVSVSGTPEMVAYLLYKDLREVYRHKPFDENIMFQMYLRCLGVVRSGQLPPSPTSP